jgi:hypothetical protein
MLTSYKYVALKKADRGAANQQIEELSDVADSAEESPDSVDALVTGLNHMHSAPPPDAIVLAVSNVSRDGPLSPSRRSRAVGP